MRSFLFGFVFMCVASAVAAVPPVAAADSPATTTVFQFPKEQELYPLVKLPDIEKLLKTHDKEVLVINFWSTSCAPCLEELPFFQEVWMKYRDKGVQFIGFNTDFDDHGAEWEKVAHDAAKRLKVTFPQYGIDIDPETYVPFFSPNWWGEQPATFYYLRGGRRAGEHLGEIEREKLEKDIEQVLAMAKQDGAMDLAIREKVKDIFAQVTTMDRAQVNDHTLVRAKLGTAADMHRLGDALGVQFNVTFGADEFSKWQTIGDVVTSVRAKIKAE